LDDLTRHDYCSRRDVEIILVENNLGPTGDVAEVARSYGVRYASEHKKGQAAALNRGIDLARGDFIAFTDDDISVRDGEWLDRLAAHVEGDRRIGYVAGNVLAAEIRTPAQAVWEAKGGLSKGNATRRFDSTSHKKSARHRVPLRLIACGANAMTTRRVLEEVGGYSEMFGCGSIVGHGQSHELVYKILRAGYSALYDPSVCVYHYHPPTVTQLRSKLFQYGVGDTAVQLHFFLEYRDYYALLQAFPGRHVYLARQLWKRWTGNYPLPANLIIAGLAGATVGPFRYARARHLSRQERRRHLN
jgi:GT2 family glycosyltransferase